MTKLEIFLLLLVGGAGFAAYKVYTDDRVVALRKVAEVYENGITTEQAMDYGYSLYQRSPDLQATVKKGVDTAVKGFVELII